VIVRILSEGQYELAESQIAPLDALDQELMAALDAGDETAFNDALSRLLARVRSEGTPVPADRFVPSDLALPHESTSLAEVRELLASESDEAS